MQNCEKRNHQRSQWLVWWTPLAGNHLHEFKAAVVQLNVRGVVVLRVDLARPQRATVFGLKRGKTRETKLDLGNSRVRKHSAGCERNGWVPCICSWFSSWGWSHTPTGMTRGEEEGLETSRLSLISERATEFQSSATFPSSLGMMTFS